MNILGVIAIQDGMMKYLPKEQYSAMIENIHFKFPPASSPIKVISKQECSGDLHIFETQVWEYLKSLK